MTTRKGGTKDYQDDYDRRYYGDDNFLKTSSYEKEKNVTELRIGELEWRNKSLEWKNRTLTRGV